jgi:3-isopropylmalate/(R)-2-methylmalate dehydratase large subunit
MTASNIIGVLGGDGIGPAATGHIVEYRGHAIEDLSIEARMTLCNMSIEAGARAGIIASDEKTIDYIRGREHAPSAWTLYAIQTETIQTPSAQLS